jgi:lipoprotein
MNKIIKSLALMSAAVFSVISCETYKVDDPEMTAISKIDGKYVTFAYENGSTQPSTVFAVLITNTTFNDSDKAWVTITDLNPAATSLNSTLYLDAVRFKVDVNLNEQTFTCSGITATEPRTAWNPYLEGAGSGQGGYYTAATKLGYKDYTISFSGKIVTGGTTGTNNNKIDTIEIDSYSRAYPDGTVKKYVVKGMKYTGWDDEMKEYNDFVKEGKFK